MVQCPDRIIASMDTGVDDALALAYLLGQRMSASWAA